MSAFVTKNQTLMRISAKHNAEMLVSIDRINKIIKDAQDWPIRFPIPLLGDVDSVRCELIRKLREEAGWAISYEKDGVSIVGGDSADTVVLNYK